MSIWETFSVVAKTTTEYIMEALDALFVASNSNGTVLQRG